MSRILRFISLKLVLMLLTLSAVASPTGHDLFDDPEPADGGWQGLARALQALEPGVDTRAPLSGSQITDRIRQLIDAGDYDDALTAIEKRQVQREHDDAIGEDVQLLFLKARAQALSGQHNEASQTYRDMTIQYPELPEPWNNLAAEYVRLGQLERAEQALETALASDPDYTEARLNLGLVQLMLAHETLSRAAKLGSTRAQRLAERTSVLLEP